ncbi:MAG: 30S ribosomal protein S20 [Deltaproteobacteria bacterium]|nr:30S ribosomal protein S20 [Deltaproteobacteria bacterium]
MATHRSALKTQRQAEKRRQRNTHVKSGLKTLTKRVMAAVEERDAEAARKVLATASRALARAASKGVIHRNNAARRISRLTRQVSALASPGAPRTAS